MGKIIRTKSRAEGGITPAVCSVAGCEKFVKSSCLCSAHYERKRKFGNPLVGGTTPGDPMRFLLEDALPYNGMDCILWPFSRNREGYGHIHYGGKTELVHRVVCEKTHGLPLSSEHEAAHSCGNGHLGCITKNHLSWKTPKENAADKTLHGTVARGEANGKSKLSLSNVLEIISLKGSASQADIAKSFNIAKPTVADIHAGRTWNWIGQSAGDHQ